MAQKNNRLIVSLFLLCGLSLSGANAVSPKNPPKLTNPGFQFPINYEKFGSFVHVGTGEYKYKLTDRAGLARVIGIGIYPNNGESMMKDAGFMKWKKSQNKKLSPWDFVNTGDSLTEFYVWGSARDIPPGAKLYFTAKALADAGYLKEALNAYYAIIIHFPTEECWSEDRSFVWYLGPNALSRIKEITEAHPELGYRLRGAVCKVTNGNDTDLKNDIFVVNPGHWQTYKPSGPVDLSKLGIINQRGNGKVHVVQYDNKQWQLIVDGKPFVVHGMTYLPTTVGHELADTANHWMWDDLNDNGVPDAPYDSWVDANKNNSRDVNEGDVGDFTLMKDMGVNAIRIYQNSQGVTYDPNEMNKKTLRNLYEKYGIRTIMGHFVGAYTVGSGAPWEDGTDYTDPVQLENMRQSVKDYVMDHRDEPYVLMWLLGNENLMPSDYSGVNATRTKASSQVEAYLKFINELAQMIHQIDPDHPVAVGNLDLVHMEEHAQYAPDVDIFGANSYRGANGFGDLFEQVREYYDRPVLIMEYGCDAYNSMTNMEDEDAQAEYHEGNWNSIRLHLAGGPEEGNAIGGVVFEFLDEWWKSQNGSHRTHEATKDSPMAFPDGWASEEWYGVMSQGDGSKSPLLRRPRKVYTLYRDKLWK